MMQMINLFLSISLVSSALAFGSTGPGISLDPQSTKISFTAVGRPSALKIKGEGAKGSGQLKIQGGNLIGEISVDLRDFQTGIALRDRHMKEKYLEVDKPEFSSAVLKVLSFTLPRGFFEKSSEARGNFTGKLRLHGVEKDVNGTATAKYETASKVFSGSAGFKVTLSDFGIDVPKFSGITVAQDVDVEVEFHGTDESQTAP